MVSPWSSPNENERVGHARPSLLVLHYTGMASEDGALKWLCSPQSQVSCHWFVREDGEAIQLVDETRRAWHAGRSCWRGIQDVNSASIGIEIANPGHEWGYRPFPARQIQSMIELCRAILSRHPIPLRNVVAHSDIAPERKMDPGEFFPWQVCAAAGVALWVPPAPLEDGESFVAGQSDRRIESAQSSLAEIGYCVPVNGLFCPTTLAVITAFQRRFRPALVDGILDVSTRLTIEAVAAAVSDQAI